MLFSPETVLGFEIGNVSYVLECEAPGSSVRHSPLVLKSIERTY